MSASSLATSSVPGVTKLRDISTWVTTHSNKCAAVANAIAAGQLRLYSSPHLPPHVWFTTNEADHTKWRNCVCKPVLPCRLSPRTAPVVTVIPVAFVIHVAANPAPVDPTPTGLHFRSPGSSSNPKGVLVHDASTQRIPPPGYSNLTDQFLLDARNDDLIAECSVLYRTGDSSVYGTNTKAMIYVNPDVSQSPNVVAYLHDALQLNRDGVDTDAHVRYTFSSQLCIPTPTTMPFQLSREEINCVRTFDPAIKVQPFTVRLGPPLQADTPSPALANEYLIDSMVDRRRLASTLASSAGIPNAVACILAASFPTALKRYDTSVLYMVGFLLYFHTSTASRAQPQICLQSYPLIADAFAYRNIAPLDGTAQNAVAAAINVDIACGAIVVPAESFTCSDINILCQIASALPRYHSPRGARSVLEENLRIGVIPIRVYGATDMAMPANEVPQPTAILATIHQLAAVRDEKVYMYRGYIRASLLASGYVWADPQGRSWWQDSLLQMGGAVMPRPQDYNFMWRWLRLVSPAPFPLDLESEISALSVISDTELLDIAMLTGALVRVAARSTLMQANITTRELNNFKYNGGSLTLMEFLGRLMDDGSNGCVLFLKLISGWFTQISAISIAWETFSTPSWSDGRIGGPSADGVNSLWRLCGDWSPGQGSVLSATRWLHHLPDTWGIIGPPVQYDFSADISLRGWFSDAGDVTYRQRASGTSPQFYVPYGLIAINVIRQQAYLVGPWVVTYQSWLRSRNLRGDSISHRSGMTQEDRQPRFNDVLRIIEPGTLLSYDWSTDTTLAPSLLADNLPATVWHQLHACPKGMIANAGVTVWTRKSVRQVVINPDDWGSYLVCSANNKENEAKEVIYQPHNTRTQMIPRSHGLDIRGGNASNSSDDVVGVANADACNIYGGEGDSTKYENAIAKNAVREADVSSVPEDQSS